MGRVFVVVVVLLFPAVICACSHESLKFTDCYFYDIATVTKDAKTSTVKGEFWTDDTLTFGLTSLRPQEGDTTVFEFREIEGIRFPSTDPRYPLVWRETPHAATLELHNQRSRPLDLVWGNTVCMEDGRVMTKGTQHVTGPDPEGTPVFRIPPWSTRTFAVPEPGLLLPNWGLTFADVPPQTRMEAHRKRLELIRSELARLPLQRFSVYLEVLADGEIHDYTITWQFHDACLVVEDVEAAFKDCISLKDYDPEALLHKLQSEPRPPFSFSRRRPRP